MIRLDWTPDDLEGVADLHLPADGHINPSDAERFMVQYEALAQVMGEHLANAHYHLEQAVAERKRAYSFAFLRSNASSDRGREAAASSAVEVLRVDDQVILLRATLKGVEAKYEGAIRASYICREILKGAHREAFL